MTGKILKTLLLLFIGVLLLPGCAVDNEHFMKIPFVRARTDTIPGLDSPFERKKIIREKGKKGASASESEKEILVAQLVYEYQTSPDPNMRREAVDALAKIPHPQRDKHLQEILQDENPFVRLSALEALGKTYSGTQDDLTTLFIEQMKRDTDKDVRLLAVHVLGDVCPKDTASELHRNAVTELGDLLYDKIPAIRYETMQTLQKITGNDYGNDINRWIQFIRFTKGELSELPSSRALAEKMPGITLPMFK